MTDTVNRVCLYDTTHPNSKGADETEQLYNKDCVNLGICKSHGDLPMGCYCGGRLGERCPVGLKVVIRMLEELRP